MSMWRDHGLGEARRYAALVGGVRPDDVLLDIGANCGEVSRLWRGHRAQAIAVEPNLLMRGALEAIHGLTCIEAAVVGGVGEDATVMFLEAERDVCSYIDEAYTGTRPPDRVVRAYAVAAVRFADLVTRYRPTVIKVDVEGAEYLFAADFLALPACVRALAVEWHGFGEDHCGCAHIYDRLLARNWTTVGDELPATFEAAVRAYVR